MTAKLPYEYSDDEWNQLSRAQLIATWSRYRQMNQVILNRLDASDPDDRAKYKHLREIIQSATDEIGRLVKEERDSLTR